MKALASAEHDKKQLKGQQSAGDNDAMLELESLDSTESGSQLTASNPSQTATQQQAAANIFNAANSYQSHFPKAIIGLLVLVGASIVWFGYQMMQLNANDAQVLLAQEKPYSNDINPEPTPIKSVIAHQLEPVEPRQTTNDLIQEPKPSIINSTDSAVNNKQSAKVQAPTTFQPEATIVGNTSITSETTTDTQPELTTTNTARLPVKSANSPSPVTLEVSSQKQPPSVDQALLDAYDAFIKGDDSNAKALYRSVLKKDIRQVDALLGMAVIAQRQSRNADAVGWYQKVLEIAPRNPTALAGIASANPSTNVISQISRLKNLIAQHPQTANYHASLGNLYAQENQWVLAQQAYFNANRFDNQNAEYAFNLAISLEHLNKPKLASTHYQRALSLVIKTGASIPNRSQIEERINALQ